MRFVEVPGLGPNEKVLVNADLVGAIIPISPLTRPPGVPASCNCQVIIGATALLFPQTAVAFRELIEPKLYVLGAPLHA